MQILLNWKIFLVNLDKVNKYFKDNLSTNYDGLTADSQSLTVVFFDTISQEDTDIINTYWDNLQETDFDPTPEELATQAIDAAISFGIKMINDASVENVLMGITQSGKTKLVSDYLESMQNLLLLFLLCLVLKLLNGSTN